MPNMVIQAAGAVLTAVGVPGAAVNVIAPVVGNAIWTGAVTAGLVALARSQVPDPASALLPMRQSRPPRRYCMGLPSRFAGAYTGAGQ